MFGYSPARWKDDKIGNSHTWGGSGGSSWKADLAGCQHSQSKVTELQREWAKMQWPAQTMGAYACLGKFRIQRTEIDVWFNQNNNYRQGLAWLGWLPLTARGYLDLPGTLLGTVSTCKEHKERALAFSWAPNQKHEIGRQLRTAL